MDSKRGTTLADIRKSPKITGRVARASDFMTEEQKERIRQANFVGRTSERKFDGTDAYCAEILARFGYEAYKAWDNGEIDEEFMARMIEAERARERAQRIPLEAIVVQMVGSCIKRNMGEPQPKGPKQAQKIMKAEIKAAKGEA